MNNSNADHTPVSGNTASGDRLAQTGRIQTSRRKSASRHARGSDAPDHQSHCRPCGGRFAPAVDQQCFQKPLLQTGDRWQFCCWNDVSHLKNIGVRESAVF